MVPFLMILALCSAGLFAGTCLYVTAVGHPVRMMSPPGLALEHFRSSLQRSERLQPALHAVSLLSTLGWATLDWNAAILPGLLCLLPILPFSLLIVMPQNRALREVDLQAPPDTIRSLLQRWGTLHSLRTTMGSLAFLALTGAAVLS